jgi:hypothetical protein
MPTAAQSRETNTHTHRRYKYESCGEISKTANRKTPGDALQRTTKTRTLIGWGTENGNVRRRADEKQETEECQRMKKTPQNKNLIGWETSGL